MMGRRSVAWLCVLLSHACIVFLLARMRAPQERVVVPELPTQPIHVFLEPRPVVAAPSPDLALQVQIPLPRMPAVAPEAPAAAPVAAAPVERRPDNVDWPLEGKRAVKRVLDAEEEAERVAKMFSGAKGTWASLTPRDRSAVKAFKWKKGVVPERDENGNAILQLSDGCVLVNFSYLACALGKPPPAYGDLFKDMRLYFDERRRPESKNGNGR